MSSRALVRVASLCNNRCVFCAQDGLPPHNPDDTSLEAELHSARASTDSLAFTGGEPTLHPALPQWIERARALGFTSIALQTNARRLADVAYTEALRRAGLTEVHASLHAGEAPAHDYHTGIPGSFAQSFAGIAAARGQGLRVVVSTVLTRSNYRSLSTLPRLLASRGVSGWCVWVPRAAGRALDGFDRIHPRLALALPFVLHALSLAEKTRLPAWIAGAPRCLLGPFVSRALPVEARSFAPGCESCAERSRCPGVDPVYLRRFEGDELVARTERGGDTLDEPVLSLFVGPGPLREEGVSPWEIAGAKGRTKVQLPMLGRPQPAKNEVSMRLEKRTGEALRELFPALFEKGTKPEGGDGNEP